MYSPHAPSASLRAQKTNIYALQVVVGTDIHVCRVSADGKKLEVGDYVPNLHVECHDRILGGQIGVSTTKNEVSYTKTYDVQGLRCGVSALYNYKENKPFAGFILESSPGISSSAQSNALSLNHSTNVSQFTPGVDTRVDLSAQVALPGTKYDVASKSVLLTGPIDVKLHEVTTTFTV